MDREGVEAAIEILKYDRYFERAKNVEDLLKEYDHYKRMVENNQEKAREEILARD